MENVDTQAGCGEHHRFLLAGDGPDKTPLLAQQHYLGIDTVSWYVNKESGWFKNYVASGTLTITLAAGEEKYDVGLGLYELKQGAFFAPIFDRPVLPERVFRGGPVTIKAILTGLKRDTVVAKLIKSTAAAALGVVNGMVQTAAASGPNAPLAAAGSSLVGGVYEILTSQKSEMALFDFSGIEATLQPAQIRGPQAFLLLHRGTELEKARLSVKCSEGIACPYYLGEPLRDGAWILLRFRRVSEYPIERVWYPEFRKWTARVVGLIDDLKNKVSGKKEALQAFKPGSETTPTAYDAYRQLRDQILNDGVLTQAEATGFAATLSEYRRLALAAIQSEQFDRFSEGIKRLRSGLAAGQLQEAETEQVFLQDYAAAGEVRPALPSILSAPELARRLTVQEMLVARLPEFSRLLKALPDAPMA